jgi:hypothetical protein
MNETPVAWACRIIRIVKSRMDWTCSRSGGDKECTHMFGGKMWKIPILNIEKMMG